MQDTQFKAIISFLLALVTNIKIAKSETSFLKAQYSCLNNGSFCCNSNIKFDLSYMLLHLNNSNFNHYLFFISLPQLSCINSIGQNRTFLIFSICYSCLQKFFFFLYQTFAKNFIKLLKRKVDNF